MLVTALQSAGLWGSVRPSAVLAQSPHTCCAPHSAHQGLCWANCGEGGHSLQSPSFSSWWLSQSLYLPFPNPWSTNLLDVLEARATNISKGFDLLPGVSRKSARAPTQHRFPSQLLTLVCGPLAAVGGGARSPLHPHLYPKGTDLGRTEPAHIPCWTCCRGDQKASCLHSVIQANCPPWWPSVEAVPTEGTRHLGHVGSVRVSLDSRGPRHSALMRSPAVHRSLV